MSADTTVHYRTCPLCEATCGLEIHTRGDEVVSVKGDKQDVFSGGFLCTKGLAIGDLHSDPDRLRTPLIRENGKFREASWEEAFARIDENISRIIKEEGRDALGVYAGNPNVHNPGLYFYNPTFMRALRTRHIYSASSVDQLPKQITAGLMFGSGNAVPIPDIDRTDYMIVMGANPFVSNGSLMTSPDFPGRAKALKERGGKLLVIDPRRTITARKASEHLFIRPGSDAYFLFAMVNVLFAENLVKTGELTEHLDGLERVRELSEEFSPEAVTERCGISADDIRRITRELAAAKSGIVYGRIGTCTQEFGTLASWLIDVVNILTGNLDRPGGVMFTRPAAAVTHTKARTGKETGVRIGKRKSRVRGLPQAYSEFPASCLAEEIETEGKGRIRALFTIAGNPVVSTPDSTALDRALGTLDFMVSIDIYLNETTKHADVILPGLSPLEDSHFDLVFMQFMVRDTTNYSPTIFEKPAGQMYEWEIMLTLANIVAGRGPKVDLQAMDDASLRGWITTLGEKPKHLADEPDKVMEMLDGERGPERIIDYLLRSGPYGERFGQNPDGLSLAKLKANPHGIDLGPLKPAVPDVIRTASGKIEMAPDTITDDIPRLRETLKKTAPEMVLIGRRHIKSNNSWMRNIERLVKGDDRTALFLNPGDAQRLGLADAGRAVIESKAGRLEANVKVTDEVMPGVVSLPHGWSADDMPAGANGESAGKVVDAYRGVNTNILTDANLYDVPSGNAVLDGIPVTVSAVAV